MTVNVTPPHDRILVTRLEAKEVAKSGIIIPDTAKEKPQEGEGGRRTGKNGEGAPRADGRTGGGSDFVW